MITDNRSDPKDQLLKLKRALEEGKWEEAKSDAKVAKILPKLSNPQPLPESLIQKTEKTQASSSREVPFKKPIQNGDAASTKVPVVEKERLPKNERVLNALVWLYETFPLAFFRSNQKPLKIGILQDIFEKLTDDTPSKKSIREALMFYTSNHAYQRSILDYTHRVDLAGNDAQEIMETEKTYAFDRHQQVLIKINAIQAKYHAKQRRQKWIEKQAAQGHGENSLNPQTEQQSQ